MKKIIPLIILSVLAFFLPWTLSADKRFSVQQCGFDVHGKWGIYKLELWGKFINYGGAITHSTVEGQLVRGALKFPLNLTEKRLLQTRGLTTLYFPLDLTTLAFSEEGDRIVEIKRDGLSAQKLKGENVQCRPALPIIKTGLIEP